jgi:hypothetical protein
MEIVRHCNRCFYCDRNIDKTIVKEHKITIETTGGSRQTIVSGIELLAVPCGHPLRYSIDFTVVEVI